MVYVSEFLLYIAFSIAMGTCLLQLVPVAFKPTLNLPRWLLHSCVLAIPILSFVPLHSTAYQYMNDFQLDYWTMLKSVILDLQIGQAWVWTCFGAAGLAIIITVPAFKNDRHMPKIAFAIMLLLTFWLGYGSHVASLDALNGLIAHAGHFKAVSIWIGILFVVSWFSQANDEQWQRFLKWYSPLALCSVFITLLAGLTLMQYTVPQYTNSLMLTYGQMLLLKHASIIPLLWLAFSNGYLYPKSMKQGIKANHITYVRSESIIALFVLGFTAIMGQSAPPHNVVETLRTQSASPLFLKLFNGSFSPDIHLSWSFNLSSVLLMISVLLLLYAILIALKHRSILATILLSCLTIILMYCIVLFGLDAQPSYNW